MDHKKAISNENCIYFSLLSTNQLLHLIISTIFKHLVPINDIILIKLKLFDGG